MGHLFCSWAQSTVISCWANDEQTFTFNSYILSDIRDLPDAVVDVGVLVKNPNANFERRLCNLMYVPVE